MARLAELEAMVAELRAELDVRDGELAAGAEVQTQLAAEAGRLENELKALRDEHGGSKDAIAALTAQVDEVRPSWTRLAPRLQRSRLRSESSARSSRVVGTRTCSSRSWQPSARSWLAWSRARRSGRPR